MPSKTETAAAADHARGLRRRQVCRGRGGGAGGGLLRWRRPLRGRSRRTRTSAEDGVVSDRWPLNQSDWTAGAREGWRDMFESSRIGGPGPGPCVAGRARTWPAGQETAVRSGGLPPVELPRWCVIVCAPRVCVPRRCPAFCLPRRRESSDASNFRPVDRPQIESNGQPSAERRRSEISRFAGYLRRPDSGRRASDFLAWRSSSAALVQSQIPSHDPVR